MPDTAKIIQNVNLGNTKEGKNTKTEQNFNPGFAPIGLSGTRPSILTTVFIFSFQKLQQRRDFYWKWNGCSSHAVFLTILSLDRESDKHS